MIDKAEKFPLYTVSSLARVLVVLKTLIYPFVAGKVAVEMAFAEARGRVSKALHNLVAETLSDAKEINELKAEIAVLRAEINEVKYGGMKNSKNAKINAL